MIKCGSHKSERTLSFEFLSVPIERKYYKGSFLCDSNKIFVYLAIFKFKQYFAFIFLSIDVIMQPVVFCDSCKSDVKHHLIEKKFFDYQTVVTFIFLF